MSSHPPFLKPKEVLRLLTRAGFIVHHVTGSHYILKHEGRWGLRVTLPMHGKDLKRRTLTKLFIGSSLILI